MIDHGMIRPRGKSRLAALWMSAVSAMAAMPTGMDAITLPRKKPASKQERTPRQCVTDRDRAAVLAAQAKRERKAAKRIKDARTE